MVCILFVDDDEEQFVVIVKKIVNLMYIVEFNDDFFQIVIIDVVGERRWNCKLIEECLDNVVELVEQGRQNMGDVMIEVLDKVMDVVDEEFVFLRWYLESVDGFIVIVLVGVLVEMQGVWVLELLGFGEVKDKDLEGMVEEVDEKRVVGEVKMLILDKIVLGEKVRRGSVVDWWMREYKVYIFEGRVEIFFMRLDMVDFVEQVIMYGFLYLVFFNFGLVFIGDFVLVILGYMWDCIGVGYVVEGRYNILIVFVDIYFCFILLFMEINKIMLVISVIFFWYYFRDVNINFKIFKIQDFFFFIKFLLVLNFVIIWIIWY